MTQIRAVVTPAMTTAFLEHAFRNIDLPELNMEDFREVHAALEGFAQTVVNKVTGQ